MKKKFRISIQENSSDIHLKLFGDFDGSSACELNESLERLSSQSNKIFIHTEWLNQISPFGRQVFHKRFPIRGDNLVFTGKHASILRPEQYV